MTRIDLSLPNRFLVRTGDRGATGMPPAKFKQGHMSEIAERIADTVLENLEVGEEARVIYGDGDLDFYVWQPEKNTIACATPNTASHKSSVGWWTC